MIDAKKWTQYSTFGEAPGPSSGHSLTGSAGKYWFLGSNIHLLNADKLEAGSGSGGVAAKPVAARQSSGVDLVQAKRVRKSFITQLDYLIL